MSLSRHPAIGLWLDDLGLGLAAALRAVEGWGLEAAGLDGLGPEVQPRTLSGTGRRDLGQQLRARGLRLAAVRADVGARRLSDPRTLDANLGRLREAFALARALGAPLVVLPLGWMPAADAPDSTVRKTLSEAVKALAEAGSTLGVRPAVVSGDESPEDLAAFLDREDPAHFLGLDLSPGLLVSRGRDVPRTLAAWGSRVCVATAADHYRGGGETSLGRGDVPWGELLVLLSTLPQAGDLALLAGCSRECDRRAALRAAVQRLSQFRASPLG